ncbi:hypothetical protein IFR05_008877 [Cadophora sp. M221]|nr:hypothetical protein IFR05_008877 [Cadophora sp. M221]
MAIPAHNFHYAIAKNSSEHALVFKSIENILFGLYLRGTTDVTLVLDTSSGKIFKEPGITFRSPQYPAKHLKFLSLEDQIPNRALFFFRYLAYCRRYEARDIDPLASNFDDCADDMLHWIKFKFKVKGLNEVRKNDDGTIDFGFVSPEPCYDMYRDWAAGKWKLEHLRYMEATTYQRDATEREQKIGSETPIYKIEDQ